MSRVCKEWIGSASELLKLDALTMDVVECAAVSDCLQSYASPEYLEAFVASESVSIAMKNLMKDLQKIAEGLSETHVEDLLDELVLLKIGTGDEAESVFQSGRVVDEDLWSSEALLKLKGILGQGSELSC